MAVERVPEIGVVHDGFLVDGHDPVPRSEPCFLCTRPHHDTADVHAIIGG